MAKPLPETTATYQPVSNSQLHEYILDSLKQKHLTVKKVLWESSNNDNIMLCKYILDTEGYEEFDMTLAVLNSYDKSRSVSIVSGATVVVCSNGMFWGSEKSFKKKHSTEVWAIIESSIVEQIENMDSIMEFMNMFYNISKYDYLPAHAIAQLLGELFIEDILSPTLVTALKRNLYSSKDFPMVITPDGKLQGGSTWNFFNNCTEALKKAPANKSTALHAKLMKHIAYSRHYKLTL